MKSTIRNINKEVIHIGETGKSLDNFIEDKSKYISTGFSNLDTKIGGLQEGSLCIIGGIPSIGKTSFILNIINNLCRQGKKVLLITLEMTYQDILLKLLSINSGFTFAGMYKILKNKESNDFNKLNEIWNKIENYNLYLAGTSGIYLSKIEKFINNLPGIDVLFIDYLQRIKVSAGKDRYEKISIISSELQTLAKKNKIPIIAVASINKSYLERSGRPLACDFRDSGNIEYDTDLAFILHKDKKSKNQAENDTIKLIVAKNRYNKAGMEITMEFFPEISMFREV
jgi:replicative DNA helicase